MPAVISRRHFLRASTLAAATIAAAACKPAATPTAASQTPKVETAKAPVPTVAPPPAEIVLDVSPVNPEYQNGERQIWDIFEEQNPGIKINMFSVNEDTREAFQAKVAGGYLPAMCYSHHLITPPICKDNYKVFLNLGTLDDFPYWDRWVYDVRRAWSDLYGLPGPRSLNIYYGLVFTWVYHEELMAEAGLDPRRDVKTWADLEKFLEEGTRWAKSSGRVDFFWDQAWHNWVWGDNYMRMIPLAFADGQQDRQVDYFMGKAKFNAPDSPFRHTFEFFKKAHTKGWIPENTFTREWETDMEASYIAKKSVMMLHGPWAWDKMLAADPTAQQLGLPSTPPADQKVWTQYMGPIEVDNGAVLLEGVQNLPEWPAIKKAFYFYHSPEAVRMRAEMEGRAPAYKLDTPVELKGPQFVGVLKDIATPGGLWEDVRYTTGLWGELAAARFRKGGSPGVWDWESNALVNVWIDLMTNKMSIQECLDWAEANWEKSYEGLPA
jgi:ABC-type glycerol-3-phosphate transport system substrate-binding protein